jgi:hypothetical protein
MTDALDGVREHYRTTGLTGHAVPDSSGEPPLITRAVSASVVALPAGMGDVITALGRFQLIALHGPSISAGAYPYVLTPAFVVPSSILLHALSLRQRIRRRAA